MNRPQTLGALVAQGHTYTSVKDEMRNNVLARLRERRPLFDGIVGFDETVIPQIVNAVLARHDMLLLGLRGQAKTRIARQLVRLLDDATPIVRGSEINDHPLRPVSRHAVDLVTEMGNDTPIEWIGREERFGEKLATPDVSVADLIGDIDPIKAAAQRLHYAHEGAIHFGIIPRTNRGIFVINELPDLQPRIQVALFNILQERDIQIRGFNVRMPMDMCMVFTANPEDYTKRGSIVTPLKDRIQAQILTHYPRSLEDGMAITAHESWVDRGSMPVVIAEFLRRIVESVAFLARTSEFVDQSSGVSARLTISTLEALVSNAERRAITTDASRIVPRLCDLGNAVTGITGKVELVFEGEEEGPLKVARALVGKAVREVFRMTMPDPNPRKKRGAVQDSDPYAAIVRWFESGNTVHIDDRMPNDEFYNALVQVPTLADLAARSFEVDPQDIDAMGPAMEFILDALHHHSKLAKDDTSASATYRDLVGSIFTPPAFEDLSD